MGAVESGWYRTEGGTVMEMDHPLPEGIAQRVARGEILRVADAEGNAYLAPEVLPVPTVAELGGQLSDAQTALWDALNVNTALLAENDALRAELEALRGPQLEPAPEAPEEPAKAPRKAAGKAGA